MFVWGKITLFVWFVGKPVHFSGKGFDSYGIKILYREIYIFHKAKLRYATCETRGYQSY